MSSKLILSAILTGLVFTCGCASRENFSQQQESYLLEATARIPAAVQTLPGVLKIRHCRAVAPFDGQYFLYRTKTGQYQQDYYKLFLTPPNEQIVEQLREGLSASGLFTNVLPASSAMPPDYTLEPHLLAIYCDFSDADNPKTVLKMHFVLLKTDKSCHCSTIVFENTYESIKSMPGRTGQDIILSFNDNLGDLLSTLMSDIARKVK
jgi:uncharacterized lipoprotein YmbA